MDSELKQFFGNNETTPEEDEEFARLSTTNRQVGGGHYLKAIQPWDIVKAWELNFWEGNCVKYLLRHRYKNRKEDLEKCIHYLEYLKAHYDELY